MAPEYLRSRRLVVYAALPDELPLAAVIASAHRDGKRILLPRMVSSTEMVLARAVRVEELRPGRYGVLEPREDAPVEHLAADALVLVPGVAFDRFGGRLGRGRGAWDRVLSERRGAVVFGVCFEMQVIDAVPREAHDQLMDALLTEAGIRRLCRP